MENDEQKQQKATPIKRKLTGRKLQAAFLAAYEECGNITAAAAMAGMDRGTHYKWINQDETYPDRFENAHNIYIDVMEAEARRRAVDGVEVPIFWQGKEVGHKRIYSDTLMIFLLKGELPDKYKERGEQDIKHSGQIHKTDLSKMSIEELERILESQTDEEEK